MRVTPKVSLLSSSKPMRLQLITGLGHVAQKYVGNGRNNMEVF